MGLCLECGKELPKPDKAGRPITFCGDVCKRRSYRHRHLPGAMWSRAKHRAAKRGMSFDITVRDVVIPAVCPVLGIPLESSRGLGMGGRYASPSLDRIDSTKGYVKGNVRVISFRANLLKSDATAAELEAVLADLKKLEET